MGGGFPSWEGLWPEWGGILGATSVLLPRPADAWLWDHLRAGGVAAGPGRPGPGPQEAWLGLEDCTAPRPRAGPRGLGSRGTHEHTPGLRRTLSEDLIFFVRRFVDLPVPSPASNKFINLN